MTLKGMLGLATSARQFKTFEEWEAEILSWPDFTIGNGKAQPPTIRKQSSVIRKWVKEIGYPTLRDFYIDATA